MRVGGASWDEGGEGGMEGGGEVEVVGVAEAGKAAEFLLFDLA